MGQKGIFEMADENFAGWRAEKTINVVAAEGITRVLVRGRPYMSWASGDEGCERLAMVQLYQCGLGTQEDLAAAFGRHVNSVRKYLADFGQAGMRGLLSERSGPKGHWKMTAGLRGKILLVALREGIWELERIQQRLAEQWQENVSRPRILQVLEENGLREPPVRTVEPRVWQGELFAVEPDRQLPLGLASAGAEPAAYGAGNGEPPRGEGEGPGSGGEEGGGDGEAGGRRHYSSGQRVYLDHLEEGDYNAYAGGLLFAPLLRCYDFIKTIREVITIPTYEGYSLEELALTLFYWDVFEFRSMEDFKRAYLEEFGVLVGRTQSPSLFTLRRFLHKVRELQRGEDLIEAFAITYLRTGLATWGVMYIDGHFMPYYGLYPIRKGWHGVRQIPMKGSYNFLAVDEHFAPWLFLIRSPAEDLLQKIPELIEKAKKLGEKAGVRRERLEQLIVLFDREGYSAELYRSLDGRDQEKSQPRVLFISWAKYADKWVNEIPEEQLSRVACVCYRVQKAEAVKYLETTRTMKKYGKIRAVVIQSGRDKQRAAIYTNGREEEIGAERIVQLICSRWGEENAIKELLHKHLINYTPGYVLEDLEEQPLVDNPEVRALKKRRGELASELNRWKIALADEVLKTMGQKSKATSSRQTGLSEKIAGTESAILLLDQKLANLPSRIHFDEAHGGEKLRGHNYEKKRFVDCIKVFAYNLKMQMCWRLLEHYGYKKEVLPALAMIVERAGYVKLEQGRLQVTLRRFKNREIDYAARRLCEDLNRMNPVTLDRYKLPIYYQVQ